MENLPYRQIAGVVGVAVGATGLAACVPSAPERPPVVFTIDSKGDEVDVKQGDGSCETALGQCTLRAAIEESNTLPGLQKVHSRIHGTPDSYNQGAEVYTIKPKVPLPDITDRVIIDFSTQPGSKKNTIPAPGPLNDVKTIEVDGSLIPKKPDGTTENGFVFRANGSELRGAAIYGFNDAISVGADNTKVTDVYLGVAADGVTPKGNVGRGAGQIADGSTNLQLGGYIPADRWLAGANFASGFSPNTDSDGWKGIGGIVGLNKYQNATIPNATGSGVEGESGAGSPSLDNSKGHLLDQMVISGNAQQGIDFTDLSMQPLGVAPYNADDVVIRRSLIGVNYKGEPFGNGNEGITFGAGSERSLVEDNIIAFNGNGGLAYHEGSNNGIARRNTIYGHPRNGVTVFDSSGVTLTDNDIYDNNGSAVELIQVFGETEDNRIVGNRLRGSTAGKPNAIGIITVRSGVVSTEVKDNEIIDESGQRAITVQDLLAPAMGFAGVPSENVVIGNDMRGVIDRNTATDTSNPPDGLADVIDNVGLTPNGVEGYMNKPDIVSASFNGQDLELDFILQAAGSDSDSYLVQFYANAGDTYRPIGSVVTSNGSRSVTMPMPETQLPVGTEIFATASAIVANKPVTTSETTAPFRTS